MGPEGQGEGAGLYSERWENLMGFFSVILLVSKDYVQMMFVLH